jgi:hypothetical protein
MFSRQVGKSGVPTPSQVDRLESGCAGTLHRAAKIPRGEKIPKGKLRELVKSPNKKVAKRARRALAWQGG